MGGSRRTLGRWIRICATFLISSASHPSVGTREAGPDPWGTGPPGPFTGRPGRLWGLFCEGRYEPPPAAGIIRRCTARWNLLRRALPPRCHRIGARHRARGAGPGRVRGYGLSAVGRAELAQDVADVLLTVSTVMNSSPAMAWFGVPAASIAGTCSSQLEAARSGLAPPRRSAPNCARPAADCWHRTKQTPARPRDPRLSPTE